MKRNYMSPQEFNKNYRIEYITLAGQTARLNEDLAQDEKIKYFSIDEIYETVNITVFDRETGDVVVYVEDGDEDQFLQILADKYNLSFDPKLLLKTSKYIVLKALNREYERITASSFIEALRIAHTTIIDYTEDNEKVYDIITGLSFLSDTEFSDNDLGLHIYINFEEEEFSISYTEDDVYLDLHNINV